MENELIIRNGAVKLAGLGPRVLAECLTEIAAKTGAGDKVVEILQQYSWLTAEVVRNVGAHRFPARPLLLVPQLDEEDDAWR